MLFRAHVIFGGRIEQAFILHLKVKIRKYFFVLTNINKQILPDCKIT
jgi:hypothetical protein